MQILVGGYIKYSDLKKKMLDLSGQFMREIPTNQNSKPISQENAFMNRPAVKLSISEEGMEGWRELVRNQKAEKADQDEEEIVMFDCMTSYVTNYSNMLYGKRTSPFYMGKGTLNDEAVDLVHAYGKLYDEIIRGYETGEREAYVRDPEAEDGMRRLTLDEELTWLGEAFRGAVNGLESMHTYLQKIWSMKIDYKGMEIRHATGAERERLLREKAEYEYRMQKKALENTIPENTKEKLISAVQEFIARYQSVNGGSVSQIVADIKALSEFRK